MTTVPTWAMYVDGYNFYCSVNDRKHPEHLYLGWCNFASLGRRIIGDRGSLVSIKYFTAPVEDFGRHGESERQALWLRALKTIPELEIVSGFHTGDRRAAQEIRYRKRKEKETDINISISMIDDATQRRYDRTILLCGDYDQRPTVRTVSGKWLRPVEVWLPLGQQQGKWTELESNLVRVQTLSVNQLRHSRLPRTLRDEQGLFEEPEKWRQRVE